MTVQICFAYMNFFILNKHLMIKWPFRVKHVQAITNIADINNIINDFRLLDFFCQAIGSIWEICIQIIRKK